MLPQMGSEDDSSDSDEEINSLYEKRNHENIERNENKTLETELPVNIYIN